MASSPAPRSSLSTLLLLVLLSILGPGVHDLLHDCDTLPAGQQTHADTVEDYDAAPTDCATCATGRVVLVAEAVATAPLAVAADVGSPLPLVWAERPEDIRLGARGARAPPRIS